MSPLVILGVLVFVAVLILSKGKSKQRPPSGTGFPWRLDKWSKGATLQPTGSGWSFVFPGPGAGNVGYVQRFTPPSLVGAEQLRVRFAVTGEGFVPQDPTTGRTATVSLVLQRQGDNWQADARTRSYRWYSSTVQVLAAGEFELKVPLNVAHWGDVYGGKDPELFAGALRELDNISLAFGSAGGRGHGVYTTTPSTFTLLALEIA